MTAIPPLVQAPFLEILSLLRAAFKRRDSSTGSNETASAESGIGNRDAVDRMPRDRFITGPGTSGATGGKA
jgi:hypothetical protein